MWQLETHHTTVVLGHMTIMQKCKGFRNASDEQRHDANHGKVATSRTGGFTFWRHSKSALLQQAAAFTPDMRFDRTR